MATRTTQRREPVQARSRNTVSRILDAAAAIIDESGVDAATTRSIADRAGVAYPSLYRFFADREEILDRLLARHLAELDALTEVAEQSWQIHSPADLISRELDLHVAYYREHSSAARLWMGGRVSPTVIRQVRQRSRTLADRLHAILRSIGAITERTDPMILLVAIELGDRVLDLAFRDRTEPDTSVIELGRTALIAYVERALPTGD